MKGGGKKKKTVSARPRRRIRGHQSGSGEGFLLREEKEKKKGEKDQDPAWEKTHADDEEGRKEKRPFEKGKGKGIAPAVRGAPGFARGKKGKGPDSLRVRGKKRKKKERQCL